MRIAAFCFFLSFLGCVLSGCAAVPPPPPPAEKQGTIADARAYCKHKKGFVPGTFEYDSCYRTRPEVEAFERNARMARLGIIVRNRSPYTSLRTKSIPIE